MSDKDKSVVCQYEASGSLYSVIKKSDDSYSVKKEDETLVQENLTPDDLIRYLAHVIHGVAYNAEKKEPVEYTKLPGPVEDLYFLNRGVILSDGDANKFLELSPCGMLLLQNLVKDSARIGKVTVSPWEGFYIAVTVRANGRLAGYSEYRTYGFTVEECPDFILKAIEDEVKKEKMNLERFAQQLK